MTISKAISKETTSTRSTAPAEMTERTAVAVMASAAITTAITATVSAQVAEETTAARVA